MKSVFVYSVVFLSKLRYESLSLKECEAYATALFNSDKENPGRRAIPEIWERDHTPIDHTLVS